MGAPSLPLFWESAGTTTPVLQFPAAVCGLPCSTPPRAINQDDLPQFSLALGDVASALFHRGSRSSALREPPSRETPLDACSADSPAIRPTRRLTKEARYQPSPPRPPPSAGTTPAGPTPPS